MAESSRRVDGRRILTVDFNRETVGRIASGEKMLAELSRKLGISQSVLRNWMRLVEHGGTEDSSRVLISIRYACHPDT
jgi:transposase-like protein